MLWEEVEPDGSRGAVQWLVAFFNDEEVLLAFPSPARLQADLDILSGLFNRVGLWTNVKKRFGWCISPATLSADTRRRGIHGG